MKTRNNPPPPLPLIHIKNPLYTFPISLYT
jgi:hypothetical protein